MGRDHDEQPQHRHTWKGREMRGPDKAWFHCDCGATMTADVTPQRVQSDGVVVSEEQAYARAVQAWRDLNTSPRKP